MNQAVIVKNPSIFWADFEAEKAVYYFFEWKESKHIQGFLEKETAFISRYISFARRYRIAEPRFNGSVDELRNEYAVYFESRNANGTKPMCILEYLYKNGNKMTYPSLLYTGDQFQQIIGIDPIHTMQDINERQSTCPLRVRMSISKTEITLSCYIDNDAFFSEVDNKKVKQDPEVGGKGFWIDNRITTKLNVPRLNSFLRDLKALCIEFGANDFSFENTLDADPENPDYFTEKGVMIDGKYFYYEDIKDELEKKGYKELPQK